MPERMQFNKRLRKDLVEKLKLLAKIENRSDNRQLEIILEEYFASRKDVFKGGSSPGTKGEGIGFVGEGRVILRLVG